MTDEPRTAGAGGRLRELSDARRPTDRGARRGPPRSAGRRSRGRASRRRCAGSAAAAPRPGSRASRRPAGRDVLRPDVDLDPVQPEADPAVVGRQGDRGRDDPAPGRPAVDPVADVRRPQRPPGDATDRQLADELAVVRPRRTAAPDRPAPPTKVPHHAAEARAARRRGPSGLVASHGRSQRRCAPAPRSRPPGPGAGSAAAATAPSVSGTGQPLVSDRPRAARRLPDVGWSPPRDLVEQVRQQRTEHGEPVAAPRPATRPG